MIDPTGLLIKTAANYIAFKTVKQSVDYVWNRKSTTDQLYKVVECPICLQVWRDQPEKCPFCSSTVLMKLYRDYDSRYEEDGFEIDTNLTVKR
jgi:predicted metal-binding protein